MPVGVPWAIPMKTFAAWFPAGLPSKVTLIFKVGPKAVFKEVPSRVGAGSPDVWLRSDRGEVAGTSRGWVTVDFLICALEVAVFLSSEAREWKIWELFARENDKGIEKRITTKPISPKSWFLVKFNLSAKSCMVCISNISYNIVVGKMISRILINTFFGVVLVFIWTRFVNISEIAEILQRVEIKFALIFIAFFVFSAIMRAFRLKLLLGKNKLPFKDILMLNLLCQFLSFMIPIRAGEITKSAYLTSQFDLPLGKSLIWVFVDRFFDFWVVLFLIAILLPFIPTGLPESSVKLIPFLFLGLTLVFVVAVLSERFFKSITNRFASFLIVEKIKNIFIRITNTIIEGVGVLRRPTRETAALLGFTFLATLGDAGIWLTSFAAVGADLGVLKIVLGTALAALTFLIPAAPGYVGSAEAAGLAIFSGVLGVEANLASAVVVFFHILTVVVILVGGITSLYLLKFDLKLVWKKLRRDSR